LESDSFSTAACDRIGSEVVSPTELANIYYILRTSWSDTLFRGLLTGFRKKDETVWCSFLIGIKLDPDKIRRAEIQFRRSGFEAY